MEKTQSNESCRSINQGSMASAGKSDRSGNRATGMAKWTFMVYMAGDNNLDGAALRDIAEMIETGTNKIVGQWSHFEGIVGR